MKIIYAGTPDFAVPALEALAQSKHQVVAVYTQPDRPAGRGRKMQFSAVKNCALKHGIEVIQPQTFKNQMDIDQLKSLDADLMVVAAYGIILPSIILDSPKLGCINIHGSLLPRWRGAAPIQRAILAGDSETGITLMQMDVGLDTGAMLAKESVKIDQTTTTLELHDSLKEIGAELLINNLDAIESSSIKAQQQDDSVACYAAKLSKQEALVDWSKPAELIHREIRAFNPWPVSHTLLQGQNVKIWSASLSNQVTDEPVGSIVSHDKNGIQVSCGDAVISITEIQFAGKKRGSAEQLLNSRNLTGEVFANS
ncbi:MAG: methionyl-tRNA formyltransferase [Gammaproteobacteria bacterium]|nr:methionyl-tRNA formyltransferase [Gammaproteobacteria bacterium]